MKRILTMLMVAMLALSMVGVASAASTRAEQKAKKRAAAAEQKTRDNAAKAAQLAAE